MGLLDFFRPKSRGSAAVAKERLKIIVAHERSQRNSPHYLPRLQEDLLEVIRRYVQVDPDDIRVSFDHRQGSREVLEINVVLPEPVARAR
ncbi:MAG: cell division topological specificity factor MinE [Deferrisomatales bacterium]